MNRVVFLGAVSLCACADFNRAPHSPPSAVVAQEVTWSQTLSREEAKALVDYGNLALRQNKLVEAISAYRQAVTLDPTYAMSHRGLGIARARSGDGDAAVEHYRAYLRLHPNAPDAPSVSRIIADYESAEYR